MAGTSQLFQMNLKHFNENLLRNTAALKFKQITICPQAVIVSLKNYVPLPSQYALQK
jgi:hypothetical protein